MSRRFTSEHLVMLANHCEDNVGPCEIADALRFASKEIAQGRAENERTTARLEAVMRMLTDAAIRGPGAWPSMLQLGDTPETTKFYVLAEHAKEWHQMAVSASKFLQGMVEHACKDVHDENMRLRAEVASLHDYVRYTKGYRR